MSRTLRERDMSGQMRNLQSDLNGVKVELSRKQAELDTLTANITAIENEASIYGMVWYGMV